ncbi:MAG: alcohol dehydrogenase catalytic domain-containing protein [Chloroflexota bacterium]
MIDKLNVYKQADSPLPTKNRLWPLYGAGLENLGRNGELISVALPQPKADELLIRHDAVGLCFSDIKVIRAGNNHPRIYRDMAKEPVVLGHEVSMTVVAVGENLLDQYQVGDRFIIQADVFVDDIGYAYGYEIQGGLSQYNIIDQRVLAGDHGNYLIPIQPQTGYAEAALTEPWACVIATYQLGYRTGLKPGGTAWIIGVSDTQDLAYTISAGLNRESHPARLLLSSIPPALEDWIRQRVRGLGVKVIKVPNLSAPPVEEVDDIVILGADADLVELVSPYLAKYGVCAVVSDDPFDRPLQVDIGRIHYNRWVFVGGSDLDLTLAYSKVPVRSTLKSGGTLWFVGAGGPMGRMHVQRAIQLADGPRTILCTDVSDVRLQDLRDSFAQEAAEKEIEFICLNPMQQDTYQVGLDRFTERGFDDIIVLAPVAPVIVEAAGYLASHGVMNVFAGLPRGSMVTIDLNDAIFRGVRIIGHSASTIDDLRLMLKQAEHGELSPNRSVAAVGSLEAARDGFDAVQTALFPGKVVIYPQIKFFPLTPLPELREKLPSVYALLNRGREWTVEAEEEFLRLMLA